jgi:2-oxoisovalerate dehydrogenase E1 component
MTVAATTPVMKFDRRQLDDETLLELYEALLLPRLIEEKMLLLLRQGKLSKWFSGIGQEAISVGCTKALESSDYIFPLHRNLGVFTSRNLPLEKLFAQWEGKRSGFSKGRERSFHFGAPEFRIIGMISHLGAMLSVADGVALASNLDRKNEIALVYSGDGGTSEGDFHEAVNVAAVWDLPVIFLIENNGYGLSTPVNEQYRCKQLIDKALGYGIEGQRVDGNNVLEVYTAMRQIIAKMRKERKPVLLEATTFRMRGHEEASGTKYVPPALFEEWGRKDPVVNYERYLLDSGLLTESHREEVRTQYKQRIEVAWERASAEPAIDVRAEDELADVYATHPLELVPPGENRQSKKRFVNAISDGMRQAMERDPNLVLMGQDIAEYGGVFKVTEGFVQQFGRERVRNTPLCESAILGAGLGLSICGHASMVEMQFADFVSCGFNQIVNNLAKTHYRWGQALKSPCGCRPGPESGPGLFTLKPMKPGSPMFPDLKSCTPPRRLTQKVSLQQVFSTQTRSFFSSTNISTAVSKA